MTEKTTSAAISAQEQLLIQARDLNGIGPAA